MQTAKISVFVAAAAAICAVASADVVTLKSGAKLIGTVDRIQGGVIEFTSEDLGGVKVPVAKVVDLVTDKPLPVEFADKTRAEGVVCATNGTFTLSGDELDLAKVKAVNPVAEKWHGSVSLSASAVRGNSTSESVTFLADVNRRWEHDRFNASMGYFFAQSGDHAYTKRKTTDRFELLGQEDHFWTAMFYSYVNGKYEFDRIMNLDYRYRIGAGIGIQWLDGQAFDVLGKWSFNQEVGMAYVRERYIHSYEDDFATFRYAHHAAWDPGWVDGFSFTHNFEFLPAVDDWDDNYIIDTDVGFVYAFMANWQLMGKAEWDYKSKVGAGAKNSDIRYTLGVGYRW